MTSRLLRIYLNDHFAGATFGLWLTRRALKSNRGTELGDFLQTLLEELEEDRYTLQRIMAALGVPKSRVKQGLAWFAERAGRLKLNGRIFSYSPLSRMMELEVLSTGVEGKRLLWSVLRSLRPWAFRLEAFPFDELLARAEKQRARLERFRLHAAHAALTQPSQERIPLLQSQTAGA